jgi:predicted permease
LFVGLAVLVALLLVVCAANVSTLLIVRGEERASLLAVHSALGATRLRVAGQLFAEAALIALGGGALGLAAGYGLLRWMQLSLSQHWGYYWMTMEVRPPVVLATFAVLLCTAVFAGTAPAVHAMRVDVARMLVSAGRGAHDPRRRRLGRWFVGAQVALSTIGLIVAAYLGWGVGRLERITERLPMDEVAVASIELPPDRYTNATARDALAAQLRAGLARISGVSAVAIGTALPGGHGGGASLVLPGDDPAAPPNRRTSWDAADGGLPATYGMRLVAGRMFTADDDANRAPVALITSETARRYFRGNAVGERIRIDGVHDANTWVEIVGVIENWIPERDDATTGRVILPLAQVVPPRLTISVRAQDPGAVLADMRRAVARIDRELPVDELTTLQARMDWFLRMWRVIAGAGLFGGLASALVAAVGLYGVISFQVRSRTREIGVRMAVGASAARIVRLFVTESVRRVLPGLVVGFALALFVVPAVSRFVSGGDAAPDALLLASVLGGMLLVGVIAALAPAWRAGRMEPQVVLRSE